MTRRFLAALALAGVVLSCAPASADVRSYPDDRARVAYGGGMARDVAEAIRRAKARGGFRAEIVALIDQVAAAQGVPAAIARALVRVESGGNPGARNGSSLGLTQIKCQTARGLGFAGSCAALFDPATNLKFGLRHAALALKRGSIGFHQAGLHAHRVSPAYVARISRAMR